MTTIISKYASAYKRVWNSPGAFNRWGKKLGLPKRLAAGVLKTVDLPLVFFYPQGTGLEQIRTRLVGPSLASILEIVSRAWAQIKNNIEDFDPQVADKKAAFLSKLYHAMEKVFKEIADNIGSGRIDPLVRLNLLKFSPEINDPNLHESEREINVGFFPIAGNPLNWGHLLAPLKSLAMVNLDALVVRVQGEIGYKKLLACERIPAQERHTVVKEALAGLYPLVRYTDLGIEENNDFEGAEEMQRFLQLNNGRRLRLFYLMGAESEARTCNYIRQQYQMMKKYHYGANPLHRITLAVIQRGEYGEKMTAAELQSISRRIKKEVGWTGKDLDLVMIKDPEIDLHVSSTYYRATQDGAFVPRAIHEWAKAQGYYGHPPIDPRTGRPVTDSQEKYFRIQLEPIAREIASQIRNALARGCPASMPLISIDGGSGSGKTTIAQEVAKYLGEQGVDCQIIGLDMFLIDRRQRIAIEKLAVGRPLNAEERNLVEDLADQIEPDKLYRNEEDTFWDQNATSDLIVGLDAFRRSPAEIFSRHFPKAYDRSIKGEREQDILIRKPSPDKVRVIIIEGKYANREALQPFYDLRYRLHDDPDRTEARFQIRSRQGSPNDADMHVIFYQLGMVPSFEAYDVRTANGIHCFIDLRGEAWVLKGGRAS